MRAHIQRWGNSLALRIPKSFAAESKIKAGSVVNLSVAKGRLIVAPLSEPAYSLEELLARVTKRNIHTAVDTGPPVGKEAL
jgi:antitoxin MazE